MIEKTTGLGAVLYSTIYINVILLALVVMTGKWMLVMAIFLTYALSGWLAHLLSQDSAYLQIGGMWLESLLDFSWVKSLLGTKTPAPPSGNVGG